MFVPTLSKNEKNVSNLLDMAQKGSTAGRESHKKQMNTAVWVAGDGDERPGVCSSSLTETVGRKSRRSNPRRLPVDGGQNDSVGGSFSRVMRRWRNKRNERARMNVHHSLAQPPSTKSALAAGSCALPSAPHSITSPAKNVIVCATSTVLLTIIGSQQVQVHNAE